MGLGPCLWRQLRVVRHRPREARPVDRQRIARRRRELKGMIHLDCIEWAHLGAQAATHARVVLEDEFIDRRHGLAAGRIACLGDVDYLRRADPFALVTRSTQLVAGFVVEQQDRQVARCLGQWRALLGILYCEHAARLFGALEPLAKCVAQVAQHDTDAACQATTVARRRMAAIDHDDAGLLFAGHRSPPFPHRSLSDRLHPSRCRCCPE